jgi:L-ribulose-5-phosphate 3-epimerase
MAPRVLMKLGYNTNGFAHHRLEDTLEILAELGYESVALTLDWHTLYPGMPGFDDRTAWLRQQFERLRLDVVIETGGRFLLDPRRKHQPTLLDPEASAREQRWRFLAEAIALAPRLGARIVSLWSGAPVRSEAVEVLWRRLAEGCAALCAVAEEHDIDLAFEPEPGMLVATLADFARLRDAVPHRRLGLTLDVGHVHCQEEGSLPELIHRWRPWLRNVHLEDMRRGIHDHLPFGTGTVPVAEVVSALAASGYTGGVHVELSRHSHDAVVTARTSRDFLLAAGWPRPPGKRGDPA